MTENQIVQAEIMPPERQANLAQSVGLGGSMIGSIQVRAHEAAVGIMSQVAAAQAMPRDELSLRAYFLNRSQDKHFADTAFYAVERGKGVAEGASINLANEVLSVWHHLNAEIIDHGDYDKVNAQGKIERFTQAQVVVWDLQTNSKYSKTINVKHWRHTRDGGYMPTGDAVMEIVNARLSKEFRNGVMKFVPKSLVNELKAACDATLARFEGTKEALTKMLAAFRDEQRVSQAQIEKYLEKPVGAFEPADIVNLRRVYAAIKSGEAPVEMFFGEGGELPPPVKAVDKPSDKPAGKAIQKPVAAKSKPVEKPAAKPSKEDAEAEAQAAENDARAKAEAQAQAEAEAAAAAEQAANDAQAEAEAAQGQDPGDAWE